MAEVQAYHVDAGAEQILQHARRISGRTEGGKDLGATLTLEHGEWASPGKGRKLAHPSRRMYTVTALCRLSSRVMERTSPDIRRRRQFSEPSPCSAGHRPKQPSMGLALQEPRANSVVSCAGSRASWPAPASVSSASPPKPHSTPTLRRPWWRAPSMSMRRSPIIQHCAGCTCSRRNASPTSSGLWLREPSRVEPTISSNSPPNGRWAGCGAHAARSWP